MTRTEILSVLSSKKGILISQFGVEKIGLFGSVSREENETRSDIDILVKFKNPTYDFWYSLKIFLEKILKKKVDLISDGKHLSERFRSRVDKEIIYA